MLICYLLPLVSYIIFYEREMKAFDEILDETSSTYFFYIKRT